MKEKSPLVFKLEPDLHKRLIKCADETGLKKYTLAILAIEAAVEAIEKNDYRLVVPIKFEVAYVPYPQRKTHSDPEQGGNYPRHNPQHSTLEGDPASNEKLPGTQHLPTKTYPNAATAPRRKEKPAKLSREEGQ